MKKEGRNNVEIARRWQKFIRGIETHVAIGTAALSLSEIELLEKGDVVICASLVEDVWNSDFDGLKSTMRIGAYESEVEFKSSAPGFRFRVVSAPEFVGTENGRLSVRNGFGEDMSNEDFEGIGLDSLVEREGAKPETESEAGVDLDSVMVDLHVRFAGRRISLSELGALQNGQVLDIGCKPDDPVEIVAENSGRPVASGQLVKVDGQLGVRVTRVFV